jgi:hypothetical protein
MDEDDLRPRFEDLPAFPGDTEAPLPPPKPWYRRLPSLIWRLFAATLVCAPLFGFFGFLFLGAFEMTLGVIGGFAAGAILGLYIDFKRSLGGGMLED